MMERKTVSERAEEIEPSVSEFRNGMRSGGLSLSSCVLEARNRFSENEPISAAALAREILKDNTSYVGGKSSKLELQETKVKQPVSAWLNDVQSLFDPNHIRKLSKLDETPVLHGRLAVVGLSLLEPQLRSQLERDDIFKAIVSEIQEPLEEILTDRGRALIESLATEQANSAEQADSVPNQPDDPLRRIEDDQLGRTAFAQYLGKRIQGIPPDSEAYSIHIYGPWGSGKSTLLNFLRSELENGKGWLTAEFNAWRHQHIRPPWWALLESIFQQTKKELTIWERFLEYLWRFNTGRVQYFLALVVLVWVLALIGIPLLRDATAKTNPIAVWGTTAESLSKALAAIITIWGIIIAMGRSLLLGSAKAAQSYMELTHDSMNEIKRRFKVLIGRLKPKRVAVFIDDLDRCQSKYVIELIEGIQTLFREAPVVFVIAADRKWLNACYEETYNELKPFVCQPGKELGVLFLEKIFQLSTSVPGIPREFKETYWQKLISVTTPENERTITEARQLAEGMLAGAGTEGAILRLVNSSQGNSFLEQRAIREQAILRLATPDVMERTEHALRPFADFLEPNPRSMKRLVNAYSVNRALGILSHIDVERDRLALWTILSSRWPLLREYLEKNPEKVVDILQESSAGIPKELEGLIKDKDVVSIVRGGPTTVPLDANTVRQCASLCCG